MKGTILIINALISTSLLADGMSGGWGRTNPHVAIGEAVIDPGEIQVSNKGAINLDKERARKFAGPEKFRSISSALGGKEPRVEEQS